MRFLLSSILALAIIGGGAVAGPLSINFQKILTDTQQTVYGVNLHQLETALELYYLDHGNYPLVSSGEQLFRLLLKEGYLTGEIEDVGVFEYQVLAQGEDYLLEIP